MKRAQFYALYGPPTLYQRIASVAAPALLVGVCVFVAVIWRSLPAEIPTSFDFDGTPNGWDGKWTLFAMPAIGLVTLGVIAICEKFPDSWNTGVRVTERNRAYIVRFVRDLMADIKLALAISFAFLPISLLYFPAQAMWFTVGIIVLATVPIVRYFIRAARVR